ncbi:MAG: TraR/DksA family transcriptional regulator [Spirochaetes bacterium]|nr:TraR/DksA family transcriptional regulator [Spirochaetota bacterium]
MRKKVQDSIKRKLIRKMNELLEELKGAGDDDISDVESENVIGDIVDRANSVYEMQIYDKLTEKERINLQEISDALKRIEGGVYGKCIVCGKAIEERRLVAIPEAKMCIICKSAAEKRKV